MSDRNDQPVTDIVEALEDAATDDVQTVGDTLEEFGRASIATALLAVSLMLVSPLSGLPLFSTFCGILIALISWQGAVGRKALWLPRRIERIRLQGRRVLASLRKIRRFAAWMDEQTEPRWGWVVTPRMSQGLFGYGAASGLCLPALEVVPFSSSIVGLGVSLMATGVLVKDGFVALIGLMLVPVALSIPFGAVAYFTM